jgi:hypothetical protein
VRKRKKGHCGFYSNIRDVVHSFENLVMFLQHCKAMSENFSEPNPFKAGLNVVCEKFDNY